MHAIESVLGGIESVLGGLFSSVRPCLPYLAYTAPTTLAARTTVRRDVS